MKFRKSWLLGSAAGALALAGGLAIAQVVLPQVVSLGQGDLVQVIPNGQAHVGNQYAPAGMIGSMKLSSYQVPLTAFTITPPNGVGVLTLNPAGTLAAGTLTMEANPSDGQDFCLWDTQTQSAITVSANTGQTLNTTIGLATPTALVAKTGYCWRYVGSLAAWYRYL